MSVKKEFSSIQLWLFLQGLILERKIEDAAAVIQILNEVPIFLSRVY